MEIFSDLDEVGKLPLGIHQAVRCRAVYLKPRSLCRSGESVAWVTRSKHGACTKGMHGLLFQTQVRTVSSLAKCRRTAAKPGL